MYIYIYIYTVSTGSCLLYLKKAKVLMFLGKRRVLEYVCWPHSQFVEHITNASINLAIPSRDAAE